MVLELNVTATVDTGVAQLGGVPVGVGIEVESEVEVEVGFVEDVGALLEAGGGVPDPAPLILISAQVRYI